MARKVMGIETKSSAAILVEHVRAHAQEATGRSRQRYQTCMNEALSLAITAGLLFDEDDFRKIVGSWLYADPEPFYSSAVKFRNASACRAYEKWKGRPAFVLGGSRLYVGETFLWAGRRLEVTSMSTTSLIACSHTWVEGEYPRRKVESRVTITLDELRAAEKGRVMANRRDKEIASIMQALSYETRGSDVGREQISALSKEDYRQALEWAEKSWGRGAPPAALQKILDDLGLGRKTGT